MAKGASKETIWAEIKESACKIDLQKYALRLTAEGSRPVGRSWPTVPIRLLAAVHKKIHVFVGKKYFGYHAPMTYGFWADVLGMFHGAIVLFVVGGQALILAGWRRKWTWTRNIWFRRVHLGLILVIMSIAALGEWCPLTVWESELRQLAGQQGYSQGMIATWLDRLLYYQAPLWVFICAYALFTLLVVWSYWKYPPQR